MFDLQLLAYQADITRIATFQIARDEQPILPGDRRAESAPPALASWRQPGKGRAYGQDQRLPCFAFCRYLGKLKDTPGNGSLLDNMPILYGSGIGNPVHDHTNLPIILAGGAAGGMRGNRHIRYDNPTPLANLHLTLLDKVGVKLDKFGDSTGKIDGLFDTLAI